MKTKIKLLKALADESRIAILQHLIEGERCACSIVPGVGKAQSTVSGHLRILEEAGILESKKVGTNIWYGVKSNEAKEILKILKIKKISAIKNVKVQNK